ncbi:hypothetical protein NM688_g578 [Phlebia brevispora]|uniref:Uncharacterized protein n=1 Tax=Phlebia brevispora TaxID=194682 RepID=A0ACC1TDR0_9APHY|nr:hypothetical protein NM688_g578 [Phlebia brevispora]
MSLVEGYTGNARDHWPQEIATNHGYALTQPDISSIPFTVEGIAEHTIVDAYKQRGGPVKLYGFIKQAKLTGFGDWNGSVGSASRAMLRLEIEGKQCLEAFKPQLDFFTNVRRHVANVLESEDTTQCGQSLQFQHVLFRKTTAQDREGTFSSTPGEDPLGKLARISKFWRLRQKPSFYKRSEHGKTTDTTPMSFNVQDFVEVVAYPEIIYKDGQGCTPNKVRICLAIEAVTRIYNEAELLAMQIPAALLQLTTLQRGRDEEFAKLGEHTPDDEAMTR